MLPDRCCGNGIEIPHPLITHFKQPLRNPAESIAKEQAFCDGTVRSEEPSVQKPINGFTRCNVGNQVLHARIKADNLFIAISDDDGAGRIFDHETGESVLLKLPLILSHHRNRPPNHVAAGFSGIDHDVGYARLFSKVANIARTDNNPEAVLSDGMKNILGFIGGRISAVININPLNIVQEFCPCGLMFVRHQQHAGVNLTSFQHCIYKIRLAYFQRHHGNRQRVFQIIGVGPSADKNVNGVVLYQSSSCQQRIVEYAVNNHDIGDRLKLRHQ